MKAHKSHKRASGGAAPSGMKEERSGGDEAKMKDYTPSDVNVEKEAKERKRGGKVEGKKPKARMDKPCRARGGRANATNSPFSSAKVLSHPVGHEMDD